MAFPSNIGTKQDSLAAAWERARAVAGMAKAQSQALRTDAEAGPIDAFRVVDLATSLAGYRAGLQGAAGLPGIVSYARAQIDDAAIDLAAEFGAMIDQIDAVISWITSNFPKDGSGFLLERSFRADGTWASRQLSSAQTAGMRTALGGLIASIN